MTQGLESQRTTTARRGAVGRAILAGALALTLVACARQRPGVAHVPAAAAVATGYAQGDPVPAHDTFTVESAALGEPRRVNVWMPQRLRVEGHRERLPVLYMPDGGVDEDFPHVANTLDSLVALGAIRPLVLVGIPNTQRRRDLTGPTRFADDSAIAPRVGGSAAFRRFVREELVPAVERRYHVSDERGIVGESLAGLFVIETLLLEPRLFTHYVAFDPSLWWNGSVLVDSAGARLAAIGLPDGAASGRPITLHVSTSGEQGIAALAARFADTLRTRAAPGLRWSYVPRPEVTHGTIFRAAKPAALADALR